MFAKTGAACDYKVCSSVHIRYSSSLGMDIPLMYWHGRLRIHDHERRTRCKEDHRCNPVRELGSWYETFYG